MEGKNKQGQQRPFSTGPALEAWIRDELPTDLVHRHVQSIASFLQSLGPHSPASGNTAAIPYDIQPHDHCNPSYLPSEARKLGLVRFIPTSRDLRADGLGASLSCAGAPTQDGQLGQCHRKSNTLPAFTYKHPAVQCYRSTSDDLPTLLYLWDVKAIVPSDAEFLPCIRFRKCWNCAVGGKSCDVTGRVLVKRGKAGSAAWQLASRLKADSEQDWVFLPTMPSAGSIRRLVLDDAAADAEPLSKRQRLDHHPLPLPVFSSSLPPIPQNPLQASREPLPSSLPPPPLTSSAAGTCAPNPSLPSPPPHSSQDSLPTDGVDPAGVHPRPPFTPQRPPHLSTPPLSSSLPPAAGPSSCSPAATKNPLSATVKAPSSATVEASPPPPPAATAASTIIPADASTTSSPTPATKVPSPVARAITPAPEATSPSSDTKPPTPSPQTPSPPTPPCLTPLPPTPPLPNPPRTTSPYAYASLTSTAVRALALAPPPPPSAPLIPLSPSTPSSPHPPSSSLETAKQKTIAAIRADRAELLELRVKRDETEADAAEASKMKKEARAMMLAAKREGTKVERMKSEIARVKEAADAALEQARQATEDAKKMALAERKRVVRELSKAKAIKEDGERLLREAESLGKGHLGLAEQAVKVDAENKLLKDEVRALQAEVKALRFLRSFSGISE